MISVVAIASLSFALTALIVYLLISLRAPRVESTKPDWIASFSIDQYRPMVRLFSEDDYQFLSSQPGYDPSIAAQLRSDRRRVARRYLVEIREDFDRLHSSVRQLAANSKQDRSELVNQLIRQRLVFSWAMLTIRLRLLTGIGRVNLRPLIGVMEQATSQAHAAMTA